MKKLTKLLALVLTAAMLLSTAAFASDNGPKLVMNWLDWDENGQCFVRDDCLSGRDYGAEGEVQMAPGETPYVIFFLIGADGKRTPVAPVAGKGVTVTPVEKEAIAPGAKQSKYYVRLELEGWADAQVTSGGGSLTIKAALPDAAFYTAAEASQSSYLNTSQAVDITKLTDKTVYFITGNDEENGRHAVDVKKNAHGNSNLYDLEKVSDNVWKITLKLTEDMGGMGVNLDVDWLDTSGNAYTEERGCGIEYPAGPELWMQWINWEENPEPDSDIHRSQPQVTPYDEIHIALYTCEDDGKKLTPVPADQLKADAGVTIEPLCPGVKGKEHYVSVSVKDWDKTYTISSGDYSMKLISCLPDLGFYSKPELKTDNYLTSWKYSVIEPNDTVYVGSYIPEFDDRYLVDLKLAKFDNSDQFTMEKASNGFYKLTKKSNNIPNQAILFDVTWGWASNEGHTEQDTREIWLEPYTTTVISETPFPNTIENVVPYDSVKDTLTPRSITMKVGETKTVYVGHAYYREDWGCWRVMCAAPINYVTSGSGLELKAEGAGNPVKFTLTAKTAGTYQVGLCDYWSWYIYDDSGKEISDELANQGIFPDYDYETGEWFFVKVEGDDVSPYELDYRIEFEVEKLNPDLYPVTVTVSGAAAEKPDTPAETSFPDVKANAWYAPAVAYAKTNGYMDGNADGTFAPTGNVTAAQLAQILYNKDGKPAAADGAAFKDVSDQWYAPAILWAAGKGIVTDTGDAAVEPAKALTRQQIALMLYNYMGKPSDSAELDKFSDAAKVSDWALDAMKWAVSAGVLSGSEVNGAMVLDPTGTATRAQTAQILMNFFQ